MPLQKTHVFRPPTLGGRKQFILHVNVLAKRFDFQGSRFCLLLCRKVCRQTLAVGFAQAERAWWRWHSWTRRSPRRPPIMTKPSDHHRNLMRRPRRHRSRERTRTGSIDTTPTRIEAQLHPKKNETPRNQTRVSWQMAVHARQKYGRVGRANAHGM